MKSENSSSIRHSLRKNGSSYAHGQDGSIKSGPGSPQSKSVAGSPPGLIFIKLLQVFARRMSFCSMNVVDMQ